MPRYTPQLEETKEKIRKANLGHSVSEETKQKISNSNKGKKRTPEMLKRMREAHLGIVLPPFTEEHKRKIALSKMGRIPWNKGKKGLQTNPRKGKRNPALVGEKNGFWKGGVTKIVMAVRGMPEYKIWQTSVFKRDNFICQSCGYSKGHIIEADHLVPLSWIIQEYKIKTIEEASRCKQIWDLNNGRTLCIPCHKLTPTWGKKYQTWIKEKNELKT